MLEFQAWAKPIFLTIVKMTEASTVKDGLNLLIVTQAHEKWEQLYPLAYYSALTETWFSKICQQFNKKVEGRWVNKGMEFHEHPENFLERLLNSQQLHKNAMKNKERFQTALRRCNNKQVSNGAERANQEIVLRNHAVIKRFFKTTYFFANICHLREFWICSYLSLWSGSRIFDW